MCVWSDTSRSWYLTLREELVKLGVTPSKYDQAIFTWHFKNKLQGIIATHVDDFYFAGSEEFEYQVINELGQDEYTKKLRSPRPGS